MPPPPTRGSSGGGYSFGRCDTSSGSVRWPTVCGPSQELDSCFLRSPSHLSLGYQSLADSPRHADLPIEYQPWHDGRSNRKLDFNRDRFMSLTDLTSARAVGEAMNEFDELGQEAFLKKYGFGEAREYFVRRNNRLYDSKAIVGVAYGYQFPDRGPLKAANFGGGEGT